MDANKAVANYAQLLQELNESKIARDRVNQALSDDSYNFKSDE